MNKNIVIAILSDRPIAYHPDIARVCGSVKAGIFLSQLLYWTDKGKRADGYIWKTQEEWEQETALTRREQETARRELKTRGLLEEKLEGIPATLHYRINTGELYAKLDAHYRQTSLAESAILDCTKAPNLNGTLRQTIPETTPKNNKDYNIYAHADSEPIHQIKTALSGISKTPFWVKTEEDYDSAACTLFGLDATPEMIAGFALWWDTHGYYTGKPSLKSILDEWSNYYQPRPDTRPETKPTAQRMPVTLESGEIVMKLVNP